MEHFENEKMNSIEGRRRILESSSDDLPIHFALLENETLIGHIKLCRCLGDDRCFYAESVVISKSARGKGLGRLLMNFAEKFLTEKMNAHRLVLQTLDAQKFYEKLGYSACGPVQFTKFRKSKSDIFLKMSQLSKNVKLPTASVQVVDSKTGTGTETRYWLGKNI